MVGFTLARYLSISFARTIVAVFVSMFLLIYLIDFVELLRRSSDAKGASTPIVAWLSLLRVPSIAEQLFPFSVLFGAMFAFLSLTRKLELVVARAAGVSVWQFLLPPLVVALAARGFRDGGLQSRLGGLQAAWPPASKRGFSGGPGAKRPTRHSGCSRMVWTDRRCCVPTAPATAAPCCRGLRRIVYDRDGSFIERVEAGHAQLRPGFWTLDDARVIAPGEEPRDVKTQLIATNLTAEQVMQKFVAPDAVPFWSLPEVRDQTARAGLNATGYSLQYQALMARPLLFMAMILVAASFSLRFFRFGGVARMVAGGVSAGFVLYVATKLVADLGGAGLLSAPVAAWTPAVVGCMLGSLALLYQEDG